MIVNINQPSMVILTEAGAEVWNAHIRKYGFKSQIKKAGDPATISLWDLMNIFGPHTYMGMPAALFENNNITIEDFNA